MSQHHNNKFHNLILSLLGSIRSALRRMTKGVMRSLLRSWMRINRRDHYSPAGFVLPTVTMVLLVVVLLTITIMLRSMDRAKMAQYRRVDEQVLQAATPALDRARAKIEYLLSKGLPTTATPSDDILYATLKGDTYNFGDETRLKVQYDINSSKKIEAAGATAALEDDEEVETAWRFPIDTDNNGKFDTYTLYGVYFRRPGTDTTGKLQQRTPLDARTLPMAPVEAAVAGCEAALGNVAGFLDDSGWSRLQGNLMKSFFVYTTSVPITSLADVPTADQGKYETKTGSTAYSALEYQQDQIRVPLTNNAVVYEDDLDITPGPAFNLNGRIVVNSNLIVTPRRNNDELTLYLVSSPESCYYNAENSKILVGGNVVNGRIGSTTKYTVPVHLYRGTGFETGTKISDTNESLTNTSEEAMYNTKAYAERITHLVDTWIASKPAGATGYNTSDPESVQEQVKNAQAGDKEKAREEALKEYFKDRTIRVPFKQVAAGSTETLSTIEIASDGTPRPKESIWRVPTNKAGNNSVAGLSFTLTQLEASDPDTKNDDNETYLGDRVLVGNNMPGVVYDDDLTGGKLSYGGEKWTNSSNERYRISQIQKLPTAGSARRDGDWETWAAEAPEAPLDAIGGLRVITGAGVYERIDSFLPPPPVLYPASSAPTKYDDPSTTATEEYEVVWPDTMPMSPVPEEKPYDNDTKAWATTGLPLLTGSTNSVDLSATTYNPKSTLDPKSRKYAKGDLRMRASAVYHYASAEYHPDDTTLPEPIACVSSYYDPTDSTTAKNMTVFPTGTTLPWNTDTGGKSNNGIVYLKPKSKLSDKKTQLEAQANMVFPDGRLVNEQLKEALSNTGTLTLAQKGAIDSTLCALDILSGDIKPVDTDPIIPHGAIKEASFLDSREVKAIHADETTTTVDETFSLSSPLTGAQVAKLDDTKFNLTLENRYPLEIRVTQLDLNQLRNAEIEQTIDTAPENSSGNEYLLPYSGIIYASRDDALPDRSDRSAGTGQIDANKSEAFSSTDYKLDPSRRPNGIMLINGQYLARGDDDGDGHSDDAPASPEDVVKQKGLILVSNLPVYIQDDFNLHSQEEFKGSDQLTQPSWSNFYTRKSANINKSFACQKGDPRLPDKCPDGDTWRPATVLADSVNVLSENFRFGFRDEGDFDLRNNAIGVKGYDFDGDGILAADTQSEVTFKLDLNGNGNKTDTAVKETEVTAKAARLLNGFNYYNNFVTNGLSSGAFNRNGSLASATSTTKAKDTDYSTLSSDVPVNSSYFNNYVTPIQRRGTFSEYVMEICLKLPVSACSPGDWVVINSSGTQIPARNLVNPSTAVNIDVPANRLKSGTTATPPDAEYQRFPRRVAFLRTSSNTLQLDGSTPIPIGINSSGEVKAYPPTSCSGINQCSVFTTSKPRTKANALWFQTRNANNKNWGSDYPLWYVDPANTATAKTTFTATVEQPLLVPVLQIHATNNTASTSTTSIPRATKLVTADTRWLTPAGNPNPSSGSTTQTTTVNVIVGAGDVPSRTDLFNGGLQNLIRLQENWETPEGGAQNTTQVLGSFIQLGRSSYATAPYESVLSTDSNVNSAFGNTISNTITGKTYLYKLENNSGRTPFFVPPARAWGYDVGLLSQAPDKFAQTYTVPSSDQEPNEYFREVSRDDKWIEALLCAKRKDNGQKAVLNQTCSTEYGS